MKSPETTTLPQCQICKKGGVFFAKKNNHDLYRCAACRFLFVWPLPDASAISAVYTADYFGSAAHGFGYMDYDADKVAMRKTFDAYLDTIERHAARGALLDVGAATGHFVELASARGWNASGIEISDYAAAKGRAKGLSIATGTLASCAFAPASFHAVTLWDVVEHMPHPGEELRRLHGLLKPGGVLAINTPDAGSVVARLLGKRWHAFVPPEHLSYFNRKNLSALLAANGFEVLATTKIAKKFTLQYFVKVFANWQRSSVLNACASAMRDTFIGKIAIPFNIRDNFLTIARKV